MEESKEGNIKKETNTKDLKPGWQPETFLSEILKIVQS
jgi:hypothetical protein